MTAFAPIPARAIGDERLSGLHLRVLMAIAVHDRRAGATGKGQGCWAGTDTLAAECKANYTNVCQAISDLGGWKYIKRETNPHDKRRRVLHVQYDDADNAFVQQWLAHRQATPARKSAEIACPKEEIACPNPKVACPEDLQAADFNEGFLTKREIEENHRRDSAEAAPSAGREREANPSAFLATINRKMRRREHVSLEEREALQSICETAEGGSAVAGWADRLLCDLESAA